VTRVATLSQINELLKKAEQSQRVLDEATEGLPFDVISVNDQDDESITIERLTFEEDIGRLAGWSTRPSLWRSSGASPTSTSKPTMISSS